MLMTETVQSSRAFVQLDGLNEHKSDFHLIEVFVVAGAILPFVLICLESSISHLCTSGPLGWLRILLWPTSILTIGAQCSYLTLTHLYSSLLNIPCYLVLGCLFWLGLQPPRSSVYLSVVGITYLTIVSVAECCEWLLTA